MWPSNQHLLCIGSDPRRTRRLLILSASNTVGGGEEVATAGFPPEASKLAAGPSLPAFRGCWAAGKAPRLLVRARTTPGLLAARTPERSVEADMATRSRIAIAKLRTLIIPSPLRSPFRHRRADRCHEVARLAAHKFYGGQWKKKLGPSLLRPHCVPLFS